jgi:hypothetical protein
VEASKGLDVYPPGKSVMRRQETGVDYEIPEAHVLSVSLCAVKLN